VIELVVVSLLIILVLAYYTLGRNTSRPTILYVLGFLFCSIVAYIYKEDWGLHKMSPTTAFVLIGGAFIFYLVELFEYRKYPFSPPHSIQIDSDDFRPIAPIKLVAFLLFQIIALSMMARSEMNYAMTDDLSDAIGTVNQDLKFDQIAISHPFYIQYPYNICIWALSLWCVYFPYYLFKSSKYNLHKILIALNLLVGTGGSLVTGGRTIILYDIIAVIFFSYICYQFKIKWIGGLFSKKVQLILISVGLIFSLLFAELGYAIGRKESDQTIAVLFSIYCGAEIKNLDDYVQHPFKQGNEKGWLGQYTFCGQYDDYQRRFEGANGVRLNQPDLAFNYYGNLPLGNVYTTYYNFILDFGILGAVLFTGFMSWLCALLYRKTITSNFWITGRPDLWMLFCVYKVPGACFLSFFANKFFEDFTLIGTLKMLFFWWLIIIFLHGFPNVGRNTKAVPKHLNI